MIVFMKLMSIIKGKLIKFTTTRAPPANNRMLLYDHLNPYLNNIISKSSLAEILCGCVFVIILILIKHMT